MVSGGMKCIKFLLVFFNFIIVLAGLALILGGTLIQTGYNEFVSFYGDNAGSAAIFVIVVGIVVFVIGFFGCCGAIKENHCMVVTFVVLLVLVLVLEIAAAITAFVLRNQLEAEIKKAMKAETKNYDVPKHEVVTEAWDKVQSKFECCGAVNYTDWENSTILSKNQSVPDSCCEKRTKGCGNGALKSLPPLNIYKVGCLKSMTNMAKSNIAILGGIAAGLTVVEIIGIIIASCLAHAIRKEYEVV